MKKVDAWSDPKFIKHWDKHAILGIGNPIRPEQLDILLSIIKDHYKTNKTILDLGVGSGLVEDLIFKKNPQAKIVGIDSSKEIMKLAEKRLKKYAKNYTPIEHDLSKLTSLKLPSLPYQIAISIQTIHNLEHQYKEKIFSYIHKMLECGGLFLLLDRIAVSSPYLFNYYLSVWKRQEVLYGHPIIKTGTTYKKYLKRFEKAGDDPITLEEHLNLLKKIGFAVACLHTHGDRALFVAKKI